MKSYSIRKIIKKEVKNNIYPKLYIPYEWWLYLERPNKISLKLDKKKKTITITSEKASEESYKTRKITLKRKKYPTIYIPRKWWVYIGRPRYVSLKLEKRRKYITMRNIRRIDF